MQKVSKQSLAMIALSILLAISIALTFTFAALTAEQKQATGTITFTGDLAITLEGFTGTSPNYTFNLTESNGKITIPETLKMKIKGNKAYMKVTIEAATGANKDAVTIAKKSTLGEDTWTELNNVYTTVNKIAVGSSVSLADLISITVDMDNLVDSGDETSKVTFVVKVDASVKDYNAA